MSHTRSILPVMLSACLFLLSGFVSVAHAQHRDKKVMDHSIYNDWKTISNIKISNDGKWACYEVRPNRGDGKLFLVNLEKNARKVFERGTSPRFSPESDYIVFRIKPQFSATRNAKKDKKSKERMPKDSLGIYRMGSDLYSKVPRVEGYAVPELASSWFAMKHYYKKDTAAVDTNDAGIRLARPEGKPSKLVVMNPVSMQKHEFENVYSYRMADDGTAVAFTRFTRIDDTIAARTVFFLDVKNGAAQEVFVQDGSFGGLELDREGKQLAFLHHPDSGRTTGMNLHYWNIRKQKEKVIVDTLTEGMPAGWGIDNNGRLMFSSDGSKLFFGTAPRPEEEPEDTLLEEEKYRVDVWNWQDPYLQPMQLKRLDSEKKRTFRSVWHVGSENMVQLADQQMESLSLMHRGNGGAALGSSHKPYRKLVSWETHRYSDYYLVDLETGNRELILKKKAFGARLSPGGNFVVWYESADSNYYSHGVRTGELNCLTCGIDDDFQDVEHDQPSLPRPYGIEGFTEKDGSVLINARYDIWKLDPSGKRLPINLTEGSGRERKIRFNYHHLEYDDPFIPLKKELVFSGSNEETKETGIYSGSALISMEPAVLAEGPASYQIVGKARNADLLCWRKGDFDEYPDIYTSDMSLSGMQRISDANPQAKEYYWGTPRLVHWNSYDGTELDGILIVPENFDPSRKYPMISYFYERSSNRLFQHRGPRPSASTISLPFYASNGYVIFVPDIVYREGYPGQSAYDAVVSGCLAMCEQFGFIDRDRMGIQGQSWGGYQVAWLVTRTDLFRAAMAGAPVSNMTSAYGGIRWGSGMSRMFQYEESQSRIGGNLWDETDLYLQNSPLFGVPDISTPLLIMHNDNDGAVPWYQGIELFVAMRRLNKPAWMLVYNNEEHNLRKWPNKVDLSIRMMQFFDHFLKGAPAPEWMDKGIPATRKGKADGYGLIEKQAPAD